MLLLEWLVLYLYICMCPTEDVLQEVTDKDISDILVKRFAEEK